MIFGGLCVPVAVYLLYLVAQIVSDGTAHCVGRILALIAIVFAVEMTIHVFGRTAGNAIEHWTLYDGHLLHSVCDRNHHLHDALSFVPRQDRMSDG